MSEALRASRRLGLLDLGLVLLAAGAVWTHTPVGASLDYAVRRTLGYEVTAPSLTAYFMAPAKRELLERAIEDLGETTLIPTEAPENGFPQPYRTAAALVMPEVLPAELDEAWDGSPEATLEQLVLGEELRTRAVERARTAGLADAERYAVHRPFLPAAAARKADAKVEAAMALGKILDMQWPIAGEHRISSGYGMRTHPVTGVHKLHNGVDLAVPVGTPVLAIQDGKVAAIGEDQANGRFVVVDHGSNVRTSYCHLDEQLVKRGDVVTRGVLIAKSGNTGRSTGPHLHFTLRVGKKTVDPLPLKPRERSGAREGLGAGEDLGG
ncbi:MAG: M23 family metallopeptidase [Deltaproteobacteria bacterium]|nr:MAG: M23 family metallopeptidase [Deltaproteobacteria bacterium]